MDERFLSGGALSEMDLDDTDYATEAPLPSPAGTPYRTPLLSRHTSRHATPSPSPSPSPYPLSSSPPTTNGRASPHHRMSMSHHHDTFDDTISILDPRRFTPTLHANLVAEILSLRRELESKTSLIDTLELDLSAARSEHETATTSAATAQREARDVKRQLARVENDGAVEAVAKERDEAVETIAELKRQVERHSKARRSAEEDLESVKASAERDREKWEDLKRAQERRAHVAEGRLKALLDELSAANAMPPPPLSMSQSEPENEDTAPSEVAMSDTASIRTSIQGRPSSLTMSDDVAERLGIRFSMLSGNQGLSLADELDLDDVEGEDEEYEGHEEEDDDDGNRTETEAEATGDNDSGSDSGSETEDEGDLQPMPKYCEMGVQVEEEEESDEEMERPEVALLEETRAELERAYFELDQKSSGLENTRIELDKAQERIRELEEQVDGLAEEVAEKKRALADKEVDHEHRIKVFETRSREVEERWASIESKESTLEKMEKSLDERATNLDRREKMLDNQEAIVTPIPDSPIEKELPLLPLDDDRVSAENDVHTQREYEANQGRKRAAGVTSPPPHHPPPIYTSIETQTEPIEEPIEEPAERQPTPPPKSPTRPPPVIYQTIGTQTDPMKPPALQIIPTIAVTPPPPTPPLPGRPRVPMRNAAVQTRNRQRTRGMQTDEPPFEDRIMKLPARLMPAAILANNNPVLPVAPSTQPERPPSPPKKSSKRNIKRIPAMAVVPTSAPAPTSVPRSVPDSPGPPGTALIYSSPKAPSEFGETPEKDKDSVRRHLFNGVDLSHDLPQSSGDDDFHDDADLSGNEFKTALSAPRPKKRDRISSLGRPSPIIGNPDGTVYEAYKKPTNIRRSAMVSNGVHAHQRPRSPSLTSNRTSESGGPKIGPPFPVPIRHSSRKVGGYASFRAESPTPMSVGLPRRALPPRRPERQQSIRKVRSAAALSTLQTSNSRTRSPPPLSASSAAPDSPILPPLPRDEVLSHTFDKQKIGSSKHKHQASTNTSNTGDASIGSSIQQISVVDAIAQTMVGEWMWKYVRRRRSFGVPDSPQAWDGRDESTTGGGQRHKRWVWLAPYERAVMWSSRQPTSGNALLGKSGRKLPIQSVLDVKDDTPLPKGVNPAQPLFNRSILILTPARALKFTAPNKERHYVWLTALSFLSHSAHESEGLLALPPPLPFEYDQMQQQRPQSPPLTRPPIPPVPVNRDPPFNPIRDSIRVAKGKGRSKTSKSEANGYAGSGSSLGRNQRRDIDRHGRIITDTIAEPPSIPRFPGHSRKRSNTTRSSTNRSISHGYNPSLHSSFGGSSNGDYYPPGPMGVGGIGLISRNSSLNHGAPGPSLGGWESGPIGTVRMEAFIDPKPKFEFDEEDEFLGNKPSSYRLRRDRRSSRQESYWSGSGDFYAGGSEAGKGSVISGSIDDEFFRGGDDPFRGF